MSPYRKAFEAIIARINGTFDDESLMSFGPLSTTTDIDILRIAHEALNVMDENANE